jgi:hypothetical protein
MNIMVTFSRTVDESSSILTKTYTEDVRGIERIDWNPHHIVFHFSDGNFYAIKADCVIDMTTYED